MIIACLDTLFDLPVAIINTVTSIVEGDNSSLNYPYISWKNAHDGVGGLLPGLSLVPSCRYQLVHGVITHETLSQ